MHKPLLLLSTCFVLVGCGTPQEQCIARETRGLRVVDRLIVEAEGNLKRGYASEDVVISNTVGSHARRCPCHRHLMSRRHQNRHNSGFALRIGTKP